MAPARWEFMFLRLKMLSFDGMVSENAVTFCDGFPY